MTRGSARKIVLALIVLAVVVDAAIYLSVYPKPRVTPGTVGSKTLDTSIRAASFLENVRYEEALALYAELLKQDPDNLVYLRNETIAAIAYVRYTVKSMQDPTQTSEQVDAIRARLPNLLRAASSAAEKYMKYAPKDPIAYRLDVMADEISIELMSTSNIVMADEDKRTLAEKLRRYAALFPSEGFFALHLDQVADALSSVDTEITKIAIQPLINAQKANPRNLALLYNLMKRLNLQGDSRLMDYVEPLTEQLTPFEWLFQMRRPPMKLDELRDAKAMMASDMETARGIVTGWVNSTNGIEGYEADNRMINISELAFVDYSDIVHAIEQKSNRVAPSTPATQFNFKTVDSDMPSADGVRFFDWDADTICELFSWQGSQISLGSIADRRYSNLATLDIGHPIVDAVFVDLFEVDSTLATKVKRTTPTNNEEGYKLFKRHETIRDILLYGPDGFTIVTTTGVVDGRPQWKIVDTKTGLNELKSVTQVVPLDIEADGDLDLAVIADGKLKLLRNLGNRTFISANSASLLPGEDVHIRAIAAIDIDRDVDIDLVVAHDQGVGIVENILHGQFRYRQLDGAWKSMAGLNQISIADLDNNHSWDVVGSTDQGLKAQTTLTVPGQGIGEKASLKLSELGGKIALADMNNDGNVDVVQIQKGEIQVFANRGDLTFANAPFATMKTADSTPSIADLNQDGKLDLAVVSDGKAVVLINQLDTKSKYLTVRVKGISDANGSGRNNQYCIGSTVELFGPFGFQARCIESDEVHFGLGDHDAQALRIIFVNGLTQGIIDPKSNSMIEEKQVLSGSCPFLYGWDGNRWTLVTDCLWNAPLGLQSALGQTIPDRRWEYLLVPGRYVQPYEGAYELRITEELWETAYFDHVALFAVDHPVDTSVYSNEKVGPAELARPGIWSVTAPMLPKTAIDHHGRSWLKELQQTDGEYAIPFVKLQNQGVAEPSWIELDFGTIDLSKRAQLVLTGWIQPTDASLNIAIDQDPDKQPPVPPSLWTVGENGVFVQAAPFIGFPGGKPKTIVVPLDGLLKSNDHRLRIAHSSQIYWDQALLAYGEEVPIASDKPIESSSLRLKKLSMTDAELRYRGFSRELPRKISEPHWYDYEHVSTIPAWPPLGGRFTRFGDVTSILSEDDDRMIVMGSGDEIRIRFAIPTEAPPAGWVREFVLHNVGWDKDASLNTLTGQSSLPLPFSSMRQYPPTSIDANEAARVETLNRETLTRKQPAYEFWNSPTPNISGL